MNQDLPFIPNCIPNVGDAEAEAVRKAVADGWLAVGPEIKQFEQAIMDFTDASHAVALSSGTAALHLALLVAGVRPGDIVPMPTLTFAATANAVVYCGASPLFLDSEHGSWSLSGSHLATYLRDGCIKSSAGLRDRRSGQRIGAILPVHLYGHPADLEPIEEIADEFDIPVVEDAAEALGAMAHGRPVGNGSRLCALSFNGNKIITGGGGGMVLTNDGDIAERIRYLSAQAKDDPVEFTHGATGYNYRMPNLNAAALLAQMRRIDSFIERKRAIVGRYSAGLADIEGVEVWREEPWARSSCWMAMLTLDADRYLGEVDSLRKHIRASGIEARPAWQPLHRQPAFAHYPHMDTPIAELIYMSNLCLPCSTGLTEAEQNRVISAVREYFKAGG